MATKTEIAQEARQELRTNAKDTLLELRKQAEDEVKRELKEQVKKDLMKKEYEKLYREEKAKVDGEYKIYVPVQITLGEKRFVGDCTVSLDEMLMINEILNRHNVERNNQTQRREYTSSTTMSGTSGQVLDSTKMVRKV